MARQTRSVKGGMNYFKRPFVLNYRDGKPTVFKIQLVRGNVIKDADFIAYAAKAAHVPESTMLTARHAILDAINYFVLNGHNVQIDGLGSFGPRINAKVSNVEANASAEDITRKYVRFYPAGEIKALCNADNIDFKEVKSLSAIAMADFVFRLRYDEDDETSSVMFLTDQEGKLITFTDPDSGEPNYNLLFDTSDPNGWVMGAFPALQSQWGTVAATAAKVNRQEGESVVLDHYEITYLGSTLKLTVDQSGAGTLSPMPKYGYVAPEGE